MKYRINKTTYLVLKWGLGDTPSVVDVATTAEDAEALATSLVATNETVHKLYVAKVYKKIEKETSPVTMTELTDEGQE